MILNQPHLCRDFVNYFKERVVPKANRLGKWALGEVNIFLSKIHTLEPFHFR